MRGEESFRFYGDVFFERFDLLGLAFIGDLDTNAMPIGYEFLYATQNPLNLCFSS